MRCTKRVSENYVTSCQPSPSRDPATLIMLESGGRLWRFCTQSTTLSHEGGMMGQSGSSILPLRKPGRPKKVESGYGGGTPEGNGSEEQKWPPRALIPRLLALEPRPLILASHPGPFETWKQRACSRASVCHCLEDGNSASCSSIRPIWTDSLTDGRRPHEDRTDAHR